MMQQYFHKKAILFLSALALLALCPGMPRASSLKPSIEDLNIRDRNGVLICSFTLKNALTDEVKKALSSGITIRYTYIFELLRPGLFRNKKVKEVRQVRYLTYDHLKQEYHILSGPGDQRMISVKDEKDAEKFAFHLHDVEIVDFDSIVQGSVYILRVKARIEQEKEAELPFSRLIRLFWNNSIETDWNEIRFRY